MSPDMRKLKQIVENLQAIPANEQNFGTFQVAMQEALSLVIEELEKTQKVIGIYRP